MPPRKPTPAPVGFSDGMMMPSIPQACSGVIGIALRPRNLSSIGALKAFFVLPRPASAISFDIVALDGRQHIGRLLTNPSLKIRLLGQLNRKRGL